MLDHNISSNYNYMLEVLKYNNISISVNMTAVKYMLTYGYMLENVTFCQEIHRLLPGTKLSVTKDTTSYEIVRYYQIDNERNINMTEDEAIECIDRSFRKAIEREFEKDIEYGYKHLVDLSGGLDSRMVSWVGDDMGYVEQLNVSYCKEGYYLSLIHIYVINVHYASGYGTLARRSKIQPILLSVWGSDVYDFPYENRLKNIIIKKNVNYAARLASTSACMAEQLRKVMENHQLDVAVTPFGVDMEAFTPTRFAKKNEEAILLGNIKMLKPKYGIAEFIQAIAVLQQKLKDEKQEDLANKIRVDIYGDGEQKAELKSLIHSLKLEKIISLKGRVPNNQVPEILNDFDVFCATSMLNSESFGVAVVEAMAMEVPVVASDVDGFKEVISDGETGIIVPRGDVGEIANALERLVCNEYDRKKMGMAGRKRVEKLYDFQKNVDMMESLYKEMVELR